MAGKNIILEPGQVLFKEGDAANGMYLIRKGELQVYLTNHGNEIPLANVEPGGMIGEMAFFDKKPRSASVRATKPTESTLITNDDFSKLMKQIPKWFVSLMVSLSTRLRETNDRLQKMEEQMKGIHAPHAHTIKCLHILSLLWSREGEKVGKDWQMNREKAEKEVTEILSFGKDMAGKILDALINASYIGAAKDDYKNNVITIPVKANLETLAKFINNFVTNFPNDKAAPAQVIQILESLDALAKKAAYDSVTLSFKEAIEEGEASGIDTASWKDCLKYIKGDEDVFKLVKTSDGDVGFKIIDKKKFNKTISYYKAMLSLANAGVA